LTAKAHVAHLLTRKISAADRVFAWLVTMITPGMPGRDL
jgi:hypothetical protein